MIDETIAFINQEVILKKVDELLNALHQYHTHDSVIWEFHGIAGIGKTTLLLEVESTCRRKDIPCAYLDLGSASHTKPLEFTSFIARIIDQWVERSVGLESDGEARAEDLLKIAQVRNGLLLIDNIDKANSNFVEWIENSFFLPALSSASLFVIVTGRKAMRWTSYEIRRTVESQPLQAFSPDSTKELLSSLGYSSLAVPLYDLSGGIPLATKLLAQAIKRIETERQAKLSRELLGDYEIRLVRSLEREYINGSIVEDVNSDLYRLIRALSVVRQFDTDTFTAFRSNLMKEVSSLETWELNTRLSLIQEVLDRGLALWDASRTAYSLRPPVRRVISVQLRLIDREGFCELSELALSFYKQKFLESQDERIIAEILFHLADVLRVKHNMPDLEIAQALTEQLRSYLEGLLSDSASALQKVIKLQEIITRDHELAERLGDRSDPNLLSRTIGDFARRIRTLNKAFLTITKLVGVDSYNVKFEITGTGGDIIPFAEDINVPERRKIALRSRTRQVSSIADLVSLGKMIRSEFLPARFQELVRELKLPLTLDVTDGEIPWELMHDGTEFIFLKCQVGKRFMTPEKPKDNYFHKREHPRILIVGAPYTTVRGFKPLPAVEDEIDWLTQHLGEIPTLSEFTDEDVLIGDRATEDKFIERLTSGDYDIIHFTGHASFDSLDPSKSALILQDYGVTASDIKRKVEGKPLIFLNACVSGQEISVESTTGYTGSYNVGLASAFILGGAIASISSLWNISDRRAAEFALAFYRHALAGDTLGESLRQSRLELRKIYPESLIWASYMLYGDPTLRIAEVIGH